MHAPKKRGAAPRPGGPGPRLRQWLVVLALCGVTLPAYSNSFSAGFTIGRRVGMARLAPVTLCLIVTAFTARTWCNSDWRDDVSLMTAAAETSPHSYKSHRALAEALYESDASHANIDRAIAEAEKSLAILDSVADWHNNAEAYRQASSYYVTKGDLLAAPESLRAYQRALDLLLRSKTIVTAIYEHAAVKQTEQAKLVDLERSISDIRLRLKDPANALDAAARDFGCPAALLNQLLQEGSPR